MTEDDIRQWRDTLLEEESTIAEYRQAYPAVDVPVEIRSAAQWLLDNPSKRKTYGGIRRFLNGWFSRCQNSGGSSGYSKTSGAGLIETAEGPQCANRDNCDRYGWYATWNTDGGTAPPVGCGVCEGDGRPYRMTRVDGEDWDSEPIEGGCDGKPQTD
jgi:hypothetical protein